jgi:flagellar biogenesis protein FliO
MSNEQQEQSAEERIGSMIGKIIVLALVAFFLWGYSTNLVAKLGFF